MFFEVVPCPKACNLGSPGREADLEGGAAFPGHAGCDLLAALGAHRRRRRIGRVDRLAVYCIFNLCRNTIYIMVSLYICALCVYMSYNIIYIRGHLVMHCHII